MKKYIIKNLCDLLDGLIVHGEGVDISGAGFVRIERLEQRSELFDTFSIPVTGRLLIEDSNVETYEVEEREFLTDNPYGKHLAEGRIDRGSVAVVWALYNRAFTAKVFSETKPIYGVNFFGERGREAHEFVQNALLDESYDWDEVVFDLQGFER
jgi:hypothetical protein